MHTVQNEYADIIVIFRAYLVIYEIRNNSFFVYVDVGSRRTLRFLQVLPQSHQDRVDISTSKLSPYSLP